MFLTASSTRTRHHGAGDAVGAGRLHLFDHHHKTVSDVARHEATTCGSWATDDLRPRMKVKSAKAVGVALDLHNRASVTH